MLLYRLSASFNDNNHVSDHFLRMEEMFIFAMIGRVGDKKENKRRNKKNH